MILIASFLIRIYRLPELLGFWYDQGRDALVIWDFINNGKFFLIGPMMGFTGMFRGPWYYYLITPFYYLGGGNPLWPSMFLISLTIFAIYVLYRVGKELGGEKTGIVAAIIASFSMYIVGASRWLSNPTPTLLIGILMVWAIFRFLDKKKWSVPLIAFLVGMGLNFGAATEIYYIPALLLIFYLNRKLIPNIKTLFISLLIFVFCFAPQILFELRHRGVLTGALYNFIFQEKTFTLNFLEILKSRAYTYYDLFYSIIWPDGAILFLPFFLIFVFNIIKNWKEYTKKPKVNALIIMFLSPFIGTLFFVSNLGGFYGYYFTGYYLIFILFFSFILSKYNKKILLLFFIIFAFKNYQTFKITYTTPLNDPEIIAFKNQIDAIGWIKNDSSDQFNVDVYVPPVVPYAYDYLFKWQDLKQADKKVNLLYTLYEVDPPHPERLDAWLNRQKGIGKVLKESRFGGIIVQRRERL